MRKLILTFGVATDAEDGGEALRGACLAALEAEGATVTSDAVTDDDRAFRVAGTIRGKPDERWEAVVRAEDEEGAEEAAVAEDDKRAVAVVDALGPAPGGELAEPAEERPGGTIDP